MPVPLLLSSPGLVSLEEDSVLTGILCSMNRTLQETDKNRGGGGAWSASDYGIFPAVHVIMGYFEAFDLNTSKATLFSSQRCD